ncbi:hypothetical protein BGX20_009991 [Mortierella sp. AD010]|nr:hypothetical protein BGX20_009991 [Mortierella sp. AD010]
MTPETPDDIEGFHEKGSVVSDISGALGAATQATKDHQYSKKTKSTYQGHIDRGKAYAARFPEMKDAFVNISYATLMMLRAFVSFQCQENNYSHKTAEGIRSAFKRYFQETFGCQGDTWKCDEDGNWSGNPVFDPPFVEYMASLKNRDKLSGVSKQSLPMSYNDMKNLMSYLQKEETIGQHTESLCLLFQAFATAGFTLWTSKGRAKIKEPFSHSRIQNVLDIFTNEAGLLEHRNGRFSTHCFRRGGAQYRLMFAEEKWSLKAVKWWGGWSEGERTGTIMRYLLDELVRYESGFGDMLSPVRNDSRHSLFMGGASATEPITQLPLGIALEGQRRETDASISSTRTELRTELQQLHQLVSNVEDSMEISTKGALYLKKMWTVSMRKSDPSKYSARKLIATEFNLLGRSEVAMKEVHGGALSLVRDLIASIRETKRQRKRSREGQEDGGEEEVEEEEVEEDDGGDEEEEDEEEKEEEEVEVLVRTKRRRV